MKKIIAILLVITFFIFCIGNVGSSQLVMDPEDITDVQNPDPIQ